MKKGFTLIELLVVVLIIGILATIALPQYQTAVDKSKFVQIQAVISDLAKEFEMYRLIHGDYPSADQWSEICPTISLEYPGCNCIDTTAHIKCYDFTIDMYKGEEKNLFAGKLDQSYAFGLFLQNSQYPNKRECCAKQNDARNEKLCKSLTGKNTPWRTVGSSALGGGMADCYDF
jgi:prepilin-type N-terminal cleavage/methylation domain-containing protein